MNSGGMNWGEVAAIVSILSTVIAGVGWLVKQNVKDGLLQLELNIQKWRASDKEENREWINGSFLRAKEANAKLDAFDDRLEAIERRLARLQR